MVGVGVSRCGVGRGWGHGFDPRAPAGLHWQELVPYDPLVDGEDGGPGQSAVRGMAWRQATGLTVTCVVAAKCGQGLILPPNHTRLIRWRDSAVTPGGGGLGRAGVAGAGGAEEGGADAEVECYRLNEALLRFEEASAACADSGGVLTSVYSMAQHDAVLTLARRLAPPNGNAVWIGLRRYDVGGGGVEGTGNSAASAGADVVWRWLWTEGNRSLGADPFNTSMEPFSRWAAGEPDGRPWINAWLAGRLSVDTWWASVCGGAGGREGAEAEWVEGSVGCGTPPAALSAAGVCARTRARDKDVRREGERGGEEREGEGEGGLTYVHAWLTYVCIFW
jgi:hypothetical protein